MLSFSKKKKEIFVFSLALALLSCIMFQVANEMLLVFPDVYPPSKTKFIHAFLEERRNKDAQCNLNSAVQINIKVYQYHVRTVAQLLNPLKPRI